MGAGISVVNASAERTFMDDMFDRIAQESGRLGVTFDSSISKKPTRIITGIYRSLAEKKKLETALQGLRGSLIDQRFFGAAAVPEDSLKFVALLRENIVNDDAEEAEGGGGGGGGGGGLSDSDEEEDGGRVLRSRAELAEEMAEKAELISRLEGELAAIDLDAIAARIAENRVKLLLADRMLATAYQEPKQHRSEAGAAYERRKGEAHTKYAEDVERARGDKAAASEDLAANQEALKQASAKFKRTAIALEKAKLDVTSLRQQIGRLPEEEEE